MPSRTLNLHSLASISRYSDDAFLHHPISLTAPVLSRRHPAASCPMTGPITDIPPHQHGMATGRFQQFPMSEMPHSGSPCGPPHPARTPWLDLFPWTKLSCPPYLCWIRFDSFQHHTTYRCHTAPVVRPCHNKRKGNECADLPQGGSCPCGGNITGTCCVSAKTRRRRGYPPRHALGSTGALLVPAPSRSPMPGTACFLWRLTNDMFLTCEVASPTAFGRRRRHRLQPR